MNATIGTFDQEHLLAIKGGILLFNSGKYWECHEELEDQWLEARGDNARYVYWAVIQAANALHHYSDGNLNGARGQISKAKDKIASVEKLHVESPVLFENLNWQAFKEVVNSIPRDPTLEHFKKLHQFQFTYPKEWEE